MDRSAAVVSIKVVQPRDPSKCTIRTYPDVQTDYHFMETEYGPVELAYLISDLSGQLARMHFHSQLKEREKCAPLPAAFISPS
jgi:hypothetical protein